MNSISQWSAKPILKVLGVDFLLGFLLNFVYRFCLCLCISSIMLHDLHTFYEFWLFFLLLSLSFTRCNFPTRFQSDKYIYTKMCVGILIGIILPVDMYVITSFSVYECAMFLPVFSFKNIFSFWALISFHFCPAL